jgi:hypothetical protein
MSLSDRTKGISRWSWGDSLACRSLTEAIRGSVQWKTRITITTQLLSPLRRKPISVDGNKSSPGILPPPSPSPCIDQFGLGSKVCLFQLLLRSDFISLFIRTGKNETEGMRGNNRNTKSLLSAHIMPRGTSTFESVRR